MFNTMAAITYKLITGITNQKQMFSSKDLYDYLQMNLVCVCMCVLVSSCEEQEKNISANNNIHCIQINHLQF